MSIRAYRVEKIELAKEDSFDLWHDVVLVDFFDREYGLYDSLNEATGLVSLPVEALKRALSELTLGVGLQKILTDDIKKEHNGYVQYYCA